MTHILSERDGGWITARLQIEPRRFLSALTHMFKRFFCEDFWQPASRALCSSATQTRRRLCWFLFFKHLPEKEKAETRQAEASFPQSRRDPLKTSTVLSAINIAVLNLWMSDEGIEADPDESMNEWWWLDWKSRAVRGGRFGGGKREREILHFVRLCLQEALLWHLEKSKETKSNKMRTMKHTHIVWTQWGGGPPCVSVKPPAYWNGCYVTSLLDINNLKMIRLD